MIVFQIERLREEGSKLLKEQQEFLKTQLRKEMETEQDKTSFEDVTPKLKARVSLASFQARQNSLLQIEGLTASYLS